MLLAALNLRNWRRGSGRSNKLVGQAGEYLVAAELARRGLIATTFTGNVPDYDIIASSENGKCLLIQVKTIRGGSFQLGDALVKKREGHPSSKELHFAIQLQSF